jgi:NAD(P)-dependent dehydrogenase (short-subunit alcohol dehydrogenase family)
MAIRRILVTGSNKGIGKAICLSLLRDYKDTHIFLCSRNIDRGNEARNDIISTINSENIENRIEVINMDLTIPSITNASKFIIEKYGDNSIYGIINNAGIGFGHDLTSIIETNIYGPYNVINSFLPLLQQEGGKIVNISSASGPMFVDKLTNEVEKQFYLQPQEWETLHSKIIEVIADSKEKEEDTYFNYGFSKACLNVYTMQLSINHPNITSTSCTPGFIDTDLTKGMGATNLPEKGTISPIHCLFSDSVISGAYYGSDTLRSPLRVYRGAGDPIYIPDGKF